MRKFRIRRLLRRSRRLLNFVKRMVDADRYRPIKKQGLYTFQVTALLQYEEALRKAHEELVKRMS